jgi:hypothetical protein
MPQLIGGPCDGQDITAEYLDKYCQMTMTDLPSKDRIILIPTQEDEEKIREGTITKDQAIPRAAYLMHKNADGSVEFRYHPQN